MKEDISIKFQVDKDLLDKVEQETYDILLQQRLKFNDRYYSSPIYVKSFLLLRVAGLAVSLFGIMLCIFYFLYPSSCPKWFFVEIFLLLFVFSAIIFWFLPRIDEKIKSKLINAGAGSCRRLAKRMVAKARKHVPYTADYTIKGDLVSYYRGKGEHWKQIWARRLKGYAVVERHAILLFRKPTSYIPGMLILMENRDEVISVLDNLGIVYEIKN